MTIGRLIGAAVIAGALVVLVLLATGGSHYTVRAEFANASGLRTNSLVEIAGQPVGRVREMRLTDDDRVLATLELDESAGPIGPGATAKVRPANLLGEKYVDLGAGRTGQPLPSGARIPVSRTGTPVELDDVLNVLDTPTRMALSALINESGIALTGRGAEFADTLQAMPSSFDRVGVLLSSLSEDNAALGRLVESSDRVVGEIADHRAGLGHLVTAANRALSATGRRNAELEATVRNAPPALTQLESSLSRLQGTAESLGGASDALTNAAPSLRALLAEIEPFADASRPTLDTAAQIAPLLTRLGRRATPVVGDLVPVAADLDRFAGGLDTTTDTLLAGLPDTLGTTEGWSRAIQGRDGAGHLFRNDASLTGDTLRALVNSIARQQAPAPTRRRRDSDKRAPAGPRPSVQQAPAPAATPTKPTVPLPLVDQLSDLTKRLPVTPPKTGVTGADDLLDYLLGP